MLYKGGDDVDTPKNLKIEYIDIDKLKPYERNARKHEEVDVLTIMSSIEHFGFDDPIGIWGKQNLIVEGHGRLLAAKKLGFKEVPCIRLDHLNDEERRAYALAHNKTAEMSAWKREFLDLELDDINDIDMSEFGFEEEIFSIDDIDDNNEVDEESGDYWTTKLTFPMSEKDKVSSYLRKHKEDIQQEIIERSGGNG